MAIIPDFSWMQLLHSGFQYPAGRNIGSELAFLVGRKEKEHPDKSTVYIITNKHVVKDQNLLYVRFNNSESVGVRDLPMSLKVNDELLYTAHPLKNTDIVAVQILPHVIVDNKLRLSFMDIDDHAITLQQMKELGLMKVV